MKDLVVNRRKILKLFFNKGDWGVDVIDLAQDRDRWKVFFEHGYEILGFVRYGNFLSEEILVSEEGLCSMALVNLFHIFVLIL